VEAAGIEPDHPQSTNRLMAHDFCRTVLIRRRFSPSIESPLVPWSRPQSWRYFGDENLWARPEQLAAIVSDFAPFRCRSRCKPESHLRNSALLLIGVPNHLSLSRSSLPEAGLHFGVGGFRMIGYEAEIF